MKFNRTQVLAVVAGLAVLVSGLGLILLRDHSLSAHFKNERLDKVIAFLEKKTGLQIETNLDPATPVTLFLHESSVGDALDGLALAVDGRCNHYAVLAGTQSEVKTYIQGMVSSAPVPDWTLHRVRVPGFALVGFASTLPDPRTSRLAVPESWPQGPLQVHLKALAESSDVTWVAPTAWDPQCGFNPGAVPVEQAFSSLVKAAKAQGRMFIFLQGNLRGGDNGPGEGQQAAWGDGRRRGEMADPSVIARRVDQQIAALPPGEQTAARESWERDRVFWEEVRQLPPEQRREKMREKMEDPQVQDRLENAQADRDARRSPEKRRDRYRDYVNRKQQAEGK